MKERIRIRLTVICCDTRESTQWRLHAHSAQPAMPAFEVSGVWRFCYAILY
jgi:hypothetical protein